jgi:hypothetical protein
VARVFYCLIDSAQVSKRSIENKKPEFCAARGGADLKIFSGFSKCAMSDSEALRHRIFFWLGKHRYRVSEPLMFRLVIPATVPFDK